MGVLLPPKYRADSAQVHPVVSRLCAPIEGTDAARLADCLGLDVSKYRGSSAGDATADELREEALLASAASLDDDALYKVQLFMLSLPSGSAAAK